MGLGVGNGTPGGGVPRAAAGCGGSPQPCSGGTDERQREARARVTERDIVCE